MERDSSYEESKVESFEEEEVFGNAPAVAASFGAGSEQPTNAV